MSQPLSQFTEWYSSKPLISRTYFTLCLFLRLVVSLEFLTINDLYYTFEMVFSNMQVWRIITTGIFQVSFPLGFLTGFYIGWLGMSTCENAIFTRQKRADFLWLAMWTYAILLTIASFLDFYFISSSFMLVFIYIWCKTRPSQIINIFFFFKIPSGFFPWLYVIISIISGQSLLFCLIGIFLAHIYIHIKWNLYAKYRKDYFPTPYFFKILFKQ